MTRWLSQLSATNDVLTTHFLHAQRFVLVTFSRSLQLPFSLAMFRYRRYRVFLAFTLIALFALYKFGNSGISWREVATSAAGLGTGDENTPHLAWKPRPAIAHETRSLKLDLSAAKSHSSLQTPPPVKHVPTPTPAKPAMATTPPKPSIPSPNRPQRPMNGKPEYEEVSSSTEVVHWTRLPEKFPVAPEDIIALPSGKPKPIPKIQHVFKPETDAAKTERVRKLDHIKSIAQKSWKGYKEHAWLHDELRPQSGNYRDPFGNWGATLVDSLDTLWIMGLKDEFEEAVQAVGKIDFTTTSRADVPVFETTIRYLGGLLAAYDLSGNTHKILLDKAVELGDVLLGAFDSPNRMPETYYYWRPQFASQRHRASPRIVLAEVGSLSMEFTRLAQLTKQPKYYDAVARITDMLEEFQNRTRLPGMWPTFFDASGCGKMPVEIPMQQPLAAPDELLGNDLIEGDSDSSASSSEKLSPNGKKYVSLKLPDPIVFKPAPTVPAVATSKGPELTQMGAKTHSNGAPLQRRQLDSDVFADSPASASQSSLPPVPECAPQGFMSTSEYGSEEFTLGGMSDSTYEYLPSTLR